MIYRIFFLVLILLTSCKEDEDDKPAKLYDITVTVTGMVTDQVTGQPVAEATVSRAINVIPRPLLYNISTLTGPDGKFSISTQAGAYSGHISPGTLMGKYINFIAKKSGYFGSNISRSFYYGFQGSGVNLQLYHYAELNLHVRNDTVNNAIDAVEIKLRRSYDPEAVFFQSCNQRKLDTTFIIKDLCGNSEYYINILKPGGQSFYPSIYYTITPKPDIVTYFEITF